MGTTNVARPVDQVAPEMWDTYVPVSLALGVPMMKIVGEFLHSGCDLDECDLEGEEHDIGPWEALGEAGQSELVDRVKEALAASTASDVVGDVLWAVSAHEPIGPFYPGR